MIFGLFLFFFKVTKCQLLVHIKFRHLNLWCGATKEFQIT